MRRCAVVVLSLIVLAATASGDVVFKRVEYHIEGHPFVGGFYFDPSARGRRPGVLVADEHGPFCKRARAEAERLAKLGYAVFTADLFGKEIEPKDEVEAARLMSLTDRSRRVIRARGKAALEVFTRQAGVNGKQIAAIGYGLGGTAMIELARTGVDLEGVVVFHGPLTMALPEDKEQVQPTFLILAGEQDAASPVREIDQFADEMKKGKVSVTVLIAKGEGHEPTVAGAAQWERKIEAYLAEEIPLKSATGAAGAKSPAVAPEGVPENALKVLKYVDEHNEAPENYEGGRTFGNYEHHLPATDSNGHRIKYREWDVNPLHEGKNRGAERLITGSDGSAYYTEDHYSTFKKVR